MSRHVTNEAQKDIRVHTTIYCSYTVYIYYSQSYSNTKVFHNTDIH